MYAFLDYLRREMAIDATILDPGELRLRVEQSLKEPWAFDKDDRLRDSLIFVLPASAPESDRERSTAPTSRIARYLRRNMGASGKP